MRIKKLEITGFKSFVDRTVIHFDEDVIGIVGPNGCGKSNIVDAIRWAMGEQSAKHLRGRSMADVIFNGSETRGPHGVAEVTLVFDNTEPEAARALPLEYADYAEIAVTRRLFRDGTSEYCINRTQVRLKDVTDLFLGTGVGTKAYSIVEQGRIGLIVSARPEDRRLLIEEAAGITKYKARKRQAEQKMEQTRQNLLRVGDIVSEIERSLTSLKRQAAKAERYVAYRGELEDLMLHEASHKLLELIVCTKVEEEACETTHELEQAARAKLDAREAELEVQRQAALASENEAESSQNAAFAADNDVRAHEAEITRARDRMTHLDERRAAAAGEQQELERTIGELAVERGELERDLATVEADEAREAQSAIEEHEELEALRGGERSADQEASELRTRAAQAAAAVAKAEATLVGFEQRALDTTRRSERLEDELGRLGLEAEDLEVRQAALARQTIELAEGKRTTAEQLTALEVELRGLRETAVTSDHALDQAKSALSQKRGRLRALEELHDRLEGVGAGVKALLETKAPAVVGLVADRIEAPAELTEAFAALFGERLQYVIVSDDAGAVDLLGELARSGRGRATVIPARPRFVAGAAPRLPSGAGVLGPLADRLRYAPEDEPLVRALVGDAVVVESAEAALRLHREGAATVLVTLDGTVLHPDGRMTGGSGDAVAAGMIEHKREMRELHEVVARMNDDVTAQLERRQELRRRLSEVGASLDLARNEAHQGELALVTAEKDLKRAQEQLETVRKREAVVKAELVEVHAMLAHAGTEQAEARRALEDNRAIEQEAGTQLEHASGLVAEWRERVSRQQAIVTERKVRIARVRERAAGVRSAIERLARSCDELCTRVGRLSDEQVECARAAGEAAAHIMLSRELLADAVRTAHMAHAELARARAELEDARQKLSTRELELRGVRQEVAEATEKLRTHEMTLQRLVLEKQHLVEGVRDRFRGLELARVVGDYHKRAPVDGSHRARIAELGELLDRMGPVNVDAVREHAEAAERFKYYSEQQTDLEKALADLDKAIAQMNRESKRLFRQTFDDINTQFKVIFPRMFRGGSAELRLTNPEDLLETGIEIMAQPPGKKLSSIELMSGGEKALTAVSLIFAIFEHKPSPFCILDEVDAPLDEANVARYNEAIRAMTDRSQFILITHIKRTMQSVDVLYGVTMQEPGVSKLVSVRVNETKRAAAPTEAAVA